MRVRWLAVALVVFLPMSGRIADDTGRVRPNDGRRPAGTLRDGVLTLHLEARSAMWHPDGDDAPGAEVPAFAERGRDPEIPGPLIRVPAGTDVVVTVRNAVPRDTLVIHGLHARPLQDATAQPLRVAPGAAGELRFRLDAPGTYYYWGTTMGRVFMHRTREDAQLSGAIVVDPPGGPPPADRILVIGMWTDTLGSPATTGLSKRLLFVVNGRSWPHTERLTYGVGDTARWRVLNISADPHPMHLHGFYFRIDSRGDGQGDTTYAEADRDQVVTQLMAVGQTIRMTWVPERPGNWLFHCHIPEHFAPRGPLGGKLPETHGAARGHAEANHALEGMNGLVVGVTVTPRAGDAAEPGSGDESRRRLRLLVRENAGGTEDAPYYGFALHEGGPEPPPASGHHVGPTIVLTRGEPVSIMVVNRTPEPTAVHWHGIELESYFDGVAGFSGAGTRLAPIIAPADSFEARFTPPRAGTFIYHTHVDEVRQQRAGLAGALVVLEPGVRFDPATDIIVLITSPSDTADAARAVLMNGSLTPAPLALRAGVPYRVRLINITTGRAGMRVELLQDGALSTWRVIAKDGADLPAARRRTGAARQAISIGETVDVEVTPAAAAEMRLEARTVTGDLLGAIPIRVR
jgi:FtsP/CotA-like multicopper oxidase with cupredoxin domain